MADVLHVIGGLDSAGVTVARVLVVLDFLQQWQALHHIPPQVGIAALALGHHPRIFQVSHADIVGGQCQPGPVGFVDILGQAALDVLEVARSTAQALAWVEPVCHAHLPGSGQGQHHHAPYPRGGGGLRIPVGFLVGDSRQQVPVHLVLFRDLADQVPVGRQRTAHIARECV